MWILKSAQWGCIFYNWMVVRKTETQHKCWYKVETNALTCNAMRQTCQLFIQSIQKGLLICPWKFIFTLFETKRKPSISLLSSFISVCVKIFNRSALWISLKLASWESISRLLILSLWDNNNAMKLWPNVYAGIFLSVHVPTIITG